MECNNVAHLVRVLICVSGQEISAFQVPTTSPKKHLHYNGHYVESDERHFHYSLHRANEIQGLPQNETEIKGIIV